jgi:sterol desaturase/sphingolipid hydroxylase (fatty acid hydroxylase superfamily)
MATSYQGDSGGIRPALGCANDIIFTDRQTMKYLIIILCIIAALFVEYLFFAFCAWDMNPAAWHWLLRLIAVIIAVPVSVIAATLTIVFISEFERLKQ